MRKTIYEEPIEFKEFKENDKRYEISKKISEIKSSIYFKRPRNSLEEAIYFDKKVINDMLNSLKSDEDYETNEALKYIIMSTMTKWMSEYMICNDLFIKMEELIINELGEDKYRELASLAAKIQFNELALNTGMEEMMMPIATACNFNPYEKE